MAGKEIQRIRDILASMPEDIDFSVERTRVQMEMYTSSYRLPKGTKVEEIITDEVLGEWVKATASPDDTVILYLHGGAYIAGSPNSHRALVTSISQETSASMLSLNYRLAPENPFPAALKDAVTAYRWLIKQGIKPERTAIAGDSAGGGLTLATMLELRDAGDPLPAAAVCISPWVDLTASSKSYQTKADKDPLVDKAGVLRTIPLYIGDNDPRNPLISPVFADLTGLPPLLIQVGSDEVLLDEVIELDKLAREAGVESELEVWEGMIHVFHMFYPILSEGREAIARIGEFLRSKIRV